MDATGRSAEGAGCLKSKLRWFLLGLGFAGAAACLLMDGAWDSNRRMAAALLTIAATLWFTEVVPPFATGLLVILVGSIFLARPLGDPELFLRPLASPVIALFFGGLVLALALAKRGLDRRMAALVLGRWGKNSDRLLWAVLGFTGLTSMFLSNTATTALMMAMLAPWLDAPEHNPNQKRRLGLAVAMAASIGGMATVIGSPTNAVAAGYLSANQHSLTFVGWMAWGLPLVLVLLGVTGWILGWAIRVPPEAAPMLANAEKGLNRGDAWVIGTGAVTVMLWMMDGWHGLPAAYVALIPVCVFFISGILTAADLRKLDWDVLLLIAGGFALGSALEKSGLAGDVAQVLSRGEQAWQVALSLGGLALFLSVFMSNTAAASLLVPIAGSVGVMDTIHAVLLTAFCCSLGMSLPVSTPPNALMHSRGWVQTRDLMVYGTLISLIALGGMVAVVALMGGS